MDDVKVRALVKYYFLARKGDLRTMWLVNDMFIKELVSACQIAKRSLSKSVDTHASKDSIATQASVSSVQRVPHPDMILQALPEVPSKGSSHPDHPEDTYEDRWLSSISREEGRRSRYSGPYVYSQPLDDDEPHQDTLIRAGKENVHGRSLDKNAMTPFVHSNESRRHTLSHPHAIQRVRSALLPVRDGAIEMERGPSISRPSSASVAPRPTHYQVTLIAEFKKIPC
jgi:hypothetical protein